MNSDTTLALQILAAGCAIAVVTWLGVVFTRAAKRGGGGMQALGAAMMLFGFGSMRDPSRNPVKEAQEGQPRRGEHSADPLDPW